MVCSLRLQLYPLGEKEMNIEQIFHKKINRRRFVKISGLATGLLLTNATRATLSSDIKATEDIYIQLPVFEHYGDKRLQINLPHDWDIRETRMKAHNFAPLSPQQIRAALNTPIGTKPLRELAQGKKRVVITVDDLERPTPAYVILPFVLEELSQAGIKYDQISCIGSFGNHAPMTQDQIIRKIGLETARTIPFFNHNCWENFVELGKTSYGTKLKINKEFMSADLKISIQGFRWHLIAGFSGGGKAVLPGVSSIESTKYNHLEIGFPHGKRNTAARPGKVKNNPVRKDMDEAALIAGLDICLVVILNGYREVIGLIACDPVTGWREACKKGYSMQLTQEVKGADIVIANAYPQCAQPQSSLPLLNQSVREGGTAVLIIQHPDGMRQIHYLARQWGRDYGGQLWRPPNPKKALVPAASHLIIFTNLGTRNEQLNFPHKQVEFCYTWPEVLAKLKKYHKNPLVAIYPYAPLQIPTSMVLDI
jgi:nickel-dependent lactate racemase